MKEKTIINIGRQFGSGGKDIAVTLGRLMDIPVYDNELIAKAAEDSGFSKELFASMDEKKNFFSFMNYITDNYVDENGIFKIQSETIKSIASKGSAVIVGRCSDYILRDFEHSVDIFITSPIEVRVSRIRSQFGLSEEQAADLIQQKDRQRETYYNYYTFGDWGAASNYDLCIDSSILGTEGTAKFIAGYIDTLAANKKE